MVNVQAVAETVFKETKVGLIPVDWDVTRLADVVEFSRKPRHLNVAQYAEIPFIPMELVPDNGTFITHYLSKQPNEVRSGSYCERGDILLAKITPSFENGKQGILEDIPLDFAYATTEVYALRPLAKKLDRFFLFHFFRLPHVRADIASRMEGTTGRQRIPKNVVEDYFLPLPPLPEQRRIAAVLNAIRDAIAAQEDVIAEARTLKRSLMQRLFTYGPGREPAETKETEIGEIPVHWDAVHLGAISKIGNGSTPKRTRYDYWEGGSIPWLTSGKVHEGIIQSADEYVSEIARIECHLPTVREGSVVVAITGEGKTLGHAALVTFDTCINQHLAYVEMHVPDVMPEFVLAFLQHRYEDLRRISRSGGSTKAALTCGVLRGYLLPYPPVAEQQQIAGLLAAADSKIAVEEDRKVALQGLFKSTLHQLMTGQIRLLSK